MASVNDLFNSNGLLAWWNQPDTQDFNAQTEWGTDFGVPANTSIGAIEGGQVVYAQEASPPGSSLGNIVIVETPDGQAWEYLHMRQLSVKQGDYVQVGDVLGQSGGCPAGGYSSAGGCSFTDQFSTGPHIEVRHADAYNPSGAPWNMNWTNPKGLIMSVANGVPAGGPIIGSGSGGGPFNLTLPPFNPAPWVDLLIRVALIIGGFLLIVAAVFIFIQGNKGVENVEGDTLKLAANAV